MPLSEVSVRVDGSACMEGRVTRLSFISNVIFPCHCVFFAYVVLDVPFLPVLILSTLPVYATV